MLVMQPADSSLESKESLPVLVAAATVTGSKHFSRKSFGAQRREFLEEQRELAPSAENVRRKVFDPPIANQKLGGGLGADPRDTGVAVGRIAYEREQVRNKRRITSRNSVRIC
jgi:hypothetical protein